MSSKEIKILNDKIESLIKAHQKERMELWGLINLLLEQKAKSLDRWKELRDLFN